jgi:hypothetical protein
VTHEAGRNLQEIVLETFTVLEREEKMEREKLAGHFLNLEESLKINLHFIPTHGCALLLFRISRGREE